MNERAALQLQILEKLASPLVGAAALFAGDQTAPAVVGLLAAAGEHGVALAQGLGTDDGAVRLSLAAITARLLAAEARQTGAIPGAPAAQKLAAGLNAALTAAEKFVGDAARLEDLDSGIARDPMQLALQQASALGPVVSAIAAQPFGQADTDLIRNIAQRLTARAEAARETLLPALGGADAKVATLEILRGLAPVYVACHEAEARRAGSADGAWQNFERQAAILETLAATAMPDDVRAVAAPRTVPPLTATAPPAAAPPAPPASAPPSSSAAAPPAGDAPANPPASNPMSFFKPGAKKPPATAEDTDAAEG